jgi:hypothetical protein
MLSSHVSLGLLTDLAAYSLPLETAVKQELLAECCVSKRAAILLAQVENLAAASSAKAEHAFPPSFSDN